MKFCGALAIAALASSGALAADWALTREEIAAARGGVPRHIATEHQVSTVEQKLDGENALSAVADALDGVIKGDWVIATFFMLDLNLKLRPRTSNATLLDTVVSLLDRGANIRFAVNENAYLPFDAALQCRKINRLQTKRDAALGCICLPENRHPQMTGSIHEKSWAITNTRLTGETELVAFEGGMDATAGRWDTQAHDGSKTRDAEPHDLKQFYGWHDELFRLKGGAAFDLMQHLTERWNDPHKAVWTPKPIVHLDAMMSTPSPNAPQVHTQFLLTAGCKGAQKGLFQNFAPSGETSIAAGFEKMVSQAQWLYLEDQFTFYVDAFKIIAKHMHHLEKIVIVTDDAATFDLNPLPGIHISSLMHMRAYHQERSFALLRAEDPEGKKVQIYNLVKPGVVPEDATTPDKWIYTHAKAYFAGAEDGSEYALVGSCGLEETGFTNDLEVMFGISDPNESQAVKKMRSDAWSEHLQVSPKKLQDPMAAFALFEKAAVEGERGVGRVRHYAPKHVESNSWAMRLAYTVYEPNGKCDPAQETVVV